MATEHDDTAEMAKAKADFFAAFEEYLEAREAPAGTADEPDSITGDPGADDTTTAEAGTDTTAPADPVDAPPVQDPVPVSPPPPPPVEPAPSPPPPPAVPPGFRLVNGRNVPLGLFGFACDVKQSDITKALAAVDRIEHGLWTAPHKAGLFTVFIGLDDQRCVSQPGFSIPKALFSELNKRGKWIVVSYPSAFKPNAGLDRFTRVIAGADDEHHRKFARWAKDSGGRFILRMGWERGADWQPFGCSDKAGHHFDPAQMVACHHHVMDVLESEAPGFFLYSDSHFRVPFLGNGHGNPPTLIAPELIALDPTRVHMVGCDLYPGGWNQNRQTLDQWFAASETSAGKKIPASLMTWAKWAHDRGLPLCVDEAGNMGRDLPEFVAGLYRRLTADLPQAGIDVAVCSWFHQADSKVVGVAGMERTLAAVRATFGATG